MASHVKFRKLQNFTAPAFLRPSCPSSLPAPCFPSVKIVNLSYLFQSILGRLPFRAEAATVLPTHALKTHRV